MNRSIQCLAAAAAVTFVAITAVSLPASAQDYPPVTYIAGYQPIYYNGFAHYYYHDHWYYRDHGGWRGYEHEPAALHERRGEWNSHARGRR